MAYVLYVEEKRHDGFTRAVVDDLLLNWQEYAALAEAEAATSSDEPDRETWGATPDAQAGQNAMMRLAEQARV